MFQVYDMKAGLVASVETTEEAERVANENRRHRFIAERPDRGLIDQAKDLITSHTSDEINWPLHRWRNAEGLSFYPSDTADECAWLSRMHEQEREAALTAAYAELYDGGLHE
jgi:hypothetical protein